MRALTPRKARLLGAAGAAGAFLAAREAMGRAREIDLADRVVLITGGSRGLGFLLAREFARQGARVGICARDRSELDEAAAKLAAEGLTVFSATCDVGKRDEVEAWIGAARQALGPVDVLVNNAGIISLAPLPNATASDFAEAMDIMFWGTVHATLAVLPGMRERRFGRIVNITSVGGKLFPPHALPYGAAKAAAVAFSEGLHAELVQDGITSTTVVPGLMRTGSDVQVKLKGGWRRDFLPWSVGASLPGLSIDAEHAARKIVRATKRGSAEVIIGLPARIATRLHGIAPGLVVQAFAVAARGLPDDDTGETTSQRGMDLQRRPHAGIVDRLRSWNRDAGRRFNQVETAEERPRVGSDGI